jgi:4-amino-4-deoxy-L-arabinose transferase-like glycosyltransferase
MVIFRNRMLVWFCLLTAVYCMGLKVDVMDVDAAQYAEISREMHSSGSILQVHDLGKDYLDKPPFAFWAASLSMTVFGIHNFSYKLPSLLFALLAIWSVFRFARLFYPEPVATLSALILGSCQGIFLMTNDCRTDTILMGAVAFGIWQFAEYDLFGRTRNLLLAAAGIGVGMLTKGPIALLVPVFGFASHFISTGQYRKLIRPSYLLALGIIAVMLLPMCVGLYRQFDLHPEKIVNGQTRVSGLKFYFWNQSFGRITGQNSWNNHPGFFFLMENMVWTFFPWFFIFLCGFGRNIYRWIRLKLMNKRSEAGKEWISTGGFGISYAALALSHYQLPHYIFIVFPFACVITASFLNDLVTRNALRRLQGFFHILQYFLIFLAVAFCLVLSLWAFREQGAGLWITGVLVLGVLGFTYIRGPLPYAWILRCVLAMAIVNLVLNAYVYPRLLQYEMGAEAGKWVYQHHIPSNDFYTLGISNQSRSLNFYSRRIVPAISEDSISVGQYILTDAAHYKKWNVTGDSLTIQGQDYPVSLLTLPFLNPKTRPEVTEPYYLVRMTGKHGG